MGFKKTHDVFIAYHGSYEQGGSRQCAQKICDFLTEKGLKCFFFPYAKHDVYKANIIEVMRSRTFLLVCSSGLHVTEEGKIDPRNHYELSTEIDAFYALTQLGEVSVTDAKVYACGGRRKGDEARLHELFANRTHFYDETGEDPAVREELFSWVSERTCGARSWQESQITSEIKEVFASRASMNQSCRFDDLVATAKSVRAVGISNSEMTARINPNAIVNCIEHGGSIELLFLDPDGQYTGQREREERLRPGRIRTITNVNLETAYDIRERINVNKEQFKLYLYDKLPRMNMIFVDDYLILQYYANNIPGIENPSFFIEKQTVSPVFTFCERAYEYLKSEAKEWEEIV